MPKIAMTARWIVTLPTAETRSDYYDLRELGLILRLSPKGSKTFFFGYRPPHGGNQQKVKLGRFPDLSLAEARQRAAMLRIEVANGNDPRVQAKEEVQTLAWSVRNVAKEYFHSPRFRKCSIKHQYDCQRAIEKDVLAKLDSILIEEVTRRDWMAVINRVEKRGKLAAAHRLFSYLKTFLNWAEDQGYIEANPIFRARYEKPKPLCTRRSLSRDEIRTFWQDIGMGEEKENCCATILRLALLTGQRIGEIAGMRREEVDLSTGTWTIPASRTKNRREHQVPLATIAVDLITKAMGVTNQDHLFLVDQDNPNYKGARAFIGSDVVGSYLRRYHREMETPSSSIWTAHELRHTFITGLNEAGVSPHIVEAIVNHVSGARAGVAGIYNHATYNLQKTEAIATWENEITKAVDLIQN